MPTKYLQVTFSSGHIYIILAEIIAKSRADHYAVKVDGYEPDSPEYNEEYDFSLSDDFELLDWAENNMNWKDVKDHTKLHAIKEPNFDSEWTNADMQIVEIPKEQA